MSGFVEFVKFADHPEHPNTERPPPGKEFEMSETTLSNTQKAYRRDPKRFLLRLQLRAERLFENRYTVEATNRPHVFVVIFPERNTERLYFVDAWEQTCTCPFYLRQQEGETLTGDGSILACKHLIGLERLVKCCRAAWIESGDLQRGYRLWSHWLQTLWARKRRRGEIYIPHRVYWPDGSPVIIATESLGLEQAEALSTYERS